MNKVIIWTSLPMDGNPNKWYDLQVVSNITNSKLQGYKVSYRKLSWNSTLWDHWQFLNISWFTGAFLDCSKCRNYSFSDKPNPLPFAAAFDSTETKDTVARCKLFFLVLKIDEAHRFRWKLSIKPCLILAIHSTTWDKIIPLPLDKKNSNWLICEQWALVSCFLYIFNNLIVH